MYYKNNDKLHEECGVFGIFSRDADINVAAMSYLALYALQHRGQESAGIAIGDGEHIQLKKGMGLVSDVFADSDFPAAGGHMAIGHVRYSTSGQSCFENAQPMSRKFKQGEIAVAHNGNLTNIAVLKEMFEEMGYTFETSSDTEIIIKMIARAARKGIERAIDDTVQAIKGSYALVMIVENKLVGVRDPNGIRPLCLGKIGESGYVFSSESCAFDSLGAKFVRDVQPGEIVIIDDDGIKSINRNEKTFSQPCAFEYVYFARPDSVIEGISVHDSRRRAGKILWKEHPAEADVVIGVPDSGIDAAMGYAQVSGIIYDIGLVKNKYVGRSFILPDQKARELAVRIKINPLRSVIENRSVVLIDDSVVRGTTSRKIIQMLREMGATKVHMRVSSPVVAFPCYFGIDTPYRDQLMGAQLTVEQMCAEMGADSLGFLSIDGLLQSLDPNRSFCLGCLDGKYPISVHMEG
ncbi:MAG: amidophosphoribosyltransferase [Oscillospiraceae bacterium]|jgi:amidophosphoribosyltransferase|nr:amidophosphoribosyltransferase [Oscillospiraceae bacterium]